MIVTGKESALYTCPECGSASVEYSELVAGQAKCLTCSWSGRKEDLLVVPLQDGAGTPEEVIMAMRGDLRLIFARSAAEFARFLVKWGFVRSKPKKGKDGLEINQKELMRYLNAMASGAMMAVFQERQKLEEKNDGK